MKLVEKMNCEIEELCVPDVYKKYGFIEEDEVMFTKVIVNTGSEQINLFVNRDENVSELIPGDSKILLKYETENNYDEYLSYLEKLIYTKFSDLTDEVKSATLKKYKISELEFLNSPKKLYVYLIEGCNFVDNL